jgi:ubiquinone/menaquinone biosynthesis C-methylase UbiE
MTTFDPLQYKKIEREAYSATARGYDKYGRDTFEAYAGPLLDAAGLKPGHHVLDVACGPGIPSLMAARLVGPTGAVTGVDLAPGMIELARARAGERAIGNALFQEGDAESLPFPDETFDVVLCSHGLVHTTDRGKALREMRRVLRPAPAALALSAWSTPDRALPVGIVAKAIRDLWPQAIQPGAPMWFDFGHAGALEEALSGASFREIHTARHTIALETETAEEYWQAVLGISGRLQMLLAHVPPGVAQDIQSAVIKAAQAFGSGGRLRIPCEEVIAVARK